ncbi:glycoside hydrolase family 16 protein [Gymnopus androsaceus JB14]|uniref:Glycoside hydrolase family 16 protein n=1 Tax=Gymnopus androsaceus JB14 TaxID=1447944 RepID=A0A6A4I4G7_9AGAR|nr:glycoside hydrolase family 16 protein [Gymnopus androsaceus JB14]
MDREYRRRYQAVNETSPTSSSLNLAGLHSGSPFSLAADPSSWNCVVGPEIQENDDYLYNPDPSETSRLSLSWRGFANVGCLAILASAVLTLFAGYPIITYFNDKKLDTSGVNSTGQVPDIGNFGLIDQDTPKDAYTLTSYTDGSTEYTLVFSDEFNQDGRTFWPGDDPYWEAVDLQYWETDDLEWYSPEAIVTKGGALRITLSEKSTHDLDYQSGMMSTWNKFCFTGGILVAAVNIAGSNNVQGLWPAVWTMGNLGRAGYGASVDGLWPYVYDECDVGTVKNQTVDGLPEKSVGLSYLEGQRLSRCTCPGSSHPGPMHSDGTYVGRSAPEIDILEAQVTDGVGYVSQSGQVAPFDYEYQWNDTAGNYKFYDSSITSFNTYLGGIYQQAASGVTESNQTCYQLNGTCFATYGIEYTPGYSSDDAYITWISNDAAAWTLYAEGLGADSTTNISARSISQEPMYLITNLGLSTSFTTIDYDNLVFPAVLSIDWIRVYQKSDEKNIGCDPEDFPTADYINKYEGAYTNPNYTTWEEFGESFPTNSYIDTC